MGEVLENIALLSLRSPFLDDSKVYAPMASLYLKAWLNKHAPQTRVYLGDDAYDTKDLTWTHNYRAVGLSVMTPQRDEMNKLVEVMRKENPFLYIVVGGPHVKHYRSEVEANPNIDFVVPYDGERPLAAICNGTADKRVLEDIMTEADLQAAPRPDRSSPNARELVKGYHYKLRDRDGKYRDATTMMTSRGCPMSCEFCEDRRTIAKWSALENLKGEMDDVKALGYGGVYLFDDLFAIAMNKVRPIAEELKKRDLIYRCNGQANFFTKWGEDFAKLLADTGCVEIAFGHESGSQKILDNVDKKTKVEQNYRSVEWAKKHGIRVKSFLMLGLPGEDLETIAATEAFIRDAQPDDFQLAVFYPYKGTEIRRKMDAGEPVELMFEGEGLGAYGQKGGSTEAVVRTKDLNSTELLRIRDELVRKYKPRSHTEKWAGDQFFDQAHKEERGGCNAG